MSSIHSWRSAGIAAVLLAFVTTGCGQSAQSAAPSALAQSPSTYDGQSVSVSGTAKGPKTRKTRRGQLVTFQLCDAACINVVEFGDASVSEGATLSLTGTFHESFGRMRRMNNVLVVGGRPGGGGGGPASQASPQDSPQASPT
jgi:hypothetical protein